MFNSFKRRFPLAIIILSFSIPAFGIWGIDYLISTYLFFFYEVEIGINPWIIALWYAIMIITTSIIAPIIGYISDRNYLFTRFLGRRFLWISFSGVIISLSTILLFWIPAFSSTFVIILFILCLLIFKIAYTLYSTSYSALLLNKFRNPKERLVVASVVEFIAHIGLFTIFSFIIGYFITFGNPISYLITAIIITLIFLGTLSLGIPGLLEEKELIDTYYSPNQARREWFLNDFFKRFVIFKQKNFLVLLFGWFGIGLFNYLFFAWLPYYLLNHDPFFIAFLSLIYYVALVIAIPISLCLSWFLGYLKIFLFSGFAMGIVLFIFAFFATDEFSILFFTGLLGFTSGLISVVLIPLMGDVLDETATFTQIRSEGFFYGLLALFGGFIPLLGSMIIRFAYTLSGYIPFQPVPPSSVLFASTIINLIPSILIITSMILFLFIYDLKPDKVDFIQEQLREMQI